MAGHKKTEADDVLLMALACGATIEKAAEKAGLGRTTVFRRLADPEFKKRLDAARSDMVQRSMGMLTAATLEAVKTLVALQDQKQPAPARLGAARAILEYGARLREEADLTKRIEALEEQMRQDLGRRSA